MKMTVAMMKTTMNKEVLQPKGQKPIFEFISQKNMQTEKIAQQARKAISRFCIEECRSYCCRKGYLVMTKEEKELVTGETPDESIIKKISENKYSMRLGNPNGCPQLKDYKCQIHANPERPQACKDFPIFTEGKSFRISNRCPAHISGKLYPYIKKLKMLGCKIEENTPFSELEFYNDS